jgi:hypothetical protein
MYVAFNSFAGEFMNKPEKKGTGTRLEIAMMAIFFIALLLLFRWLVNPALIYQSQEPIFFTTGSFFSEQMSHPGGPVGYLAALLGQFFIFPWIGAFMITLVISAAACLTRAMLKIHKAPEIPALFLLPAIFLTMLHSIYRYPLSNSLGLVLSLSFFLLYLLLQNRGPVVRGCMAVLFAVFLYFLTAGPFLLFVVLCVMHEIGRRNVIIPLFTAATAVLVPWLAAQFVFLYPVKIVYLAQLPFDATYAPRFIPWALYLIFPCLMMCALVWARWFSAAKSKTVDFIKKCGSYNHGRVIYLLQYLILVLLTAGAVFLSFNRFDKTLLQAEEDVRMNRWQELIDNVAVQKFASNQLIHYIYRALYHTNRLSTDLFFYSRADGAQDILFSKEIGQFAPWAYSDFFFDVGLLNESQHWAFEALTIHGPTVWVLQRLAEINILKGEKLAALKFLKNLENTLFSKKWAKKYEQYLENPGLIDQNPLLRRARANASNQDFITINQNPYSALESLFQRNKSNKMVFEYLSTYDLLTVRLESFMARMPLLKDYGYREIPRIFEEAIVVYLSIKKLPFFEIPGMSVNRNTSDRFIEFQKVYASYKGDKNAAFPELSRKFSQTYWFYLMYKKPVSQGTAEQKPGGTK